MAKKRFIADICYSLDNVNGQLALIQEDVSLIFDMYVPAKTKPVRFNHEQTHFTINNQDPLKLLKIFELKVYLIRRYIKNM